MTSSIAKRILAIATTAMLATTLAACGGTSSAPASEKPKSLSEAKEKAEKSNETKTEEKKEEKAEEKKEEKKESSEASNEEIHPMLEVMVEAINDLDIKTLPGGEMLESVRGKAEAPGTLIYEFKVKGDLQNSFLAEAMDKNADTTLAPVAKQIKEQMASLGIKSPKVVWRYLDKNDNMIWERGY